MNYQATQDPEMNTFRKLNADLHYQSSVIKQQQKNMAALIKEKYQAERELMLWKNATILFFIAAVMAFVVTG